MSPRTYTDDQKKTVGEAAKARWADPEKRAATIAKMKASGATRRAENKLRKAREAEAAKAAPEAKPENPEAINRAIAQLPPDPNPEPEVSEEELLDSVPKH